MTDRSDAPTTAGWSDPTRSIDDRLDALLAELTTVEKIAQLLSYWPRPASKDRTTGEVAPMQAAMDAGRGGFDETAAHGLGQLTRIFGTSPLPVAEGVAELRRWQREVVSRSRLGIPAMAHEECLTGFTALGATVYPAAPAWGATFDPELITELGEAIGSDLAAVGVHQGLAPLLDVVRDYRWGRVEETIGEDPYLVGMLGSAYVRGLESAGVVATLKHFAGYSASKAGRNHAPVPMGRREFTDMILTPFEMAVRLGGTRSVMNSYSDVDGVPVAADHELLTTILRERWGFEGTVVSDYWSITFLELMHRVAVDGQHAGALALSAGLDVELPEGNTFRRLDAALAEGQITPAELDTAVARVLRHKLELGLLDVGYDPDRVGEPIDLDSPRNRALARRLAERSITLLANDGTLPLAAEQRVAVIGPTAAEIRTFLGCYSFPNHVLGRLPEGGVGLPGDDLLTAMVDRFAAVDHALGVPILADDLTGLPAAVEAARTADVAVVAVGDLAGMFGTGTSGEGCDSVDLSLPGRQHDLVEAVLATGTPVVLVVVSGRPYALGDVADRCAAVVQAWMPGIEGGPALADVLIGAVEPTGRLPIAIPVHPGGQPGTYLAAPLAWSTDGVSNLDPRPLYPFGHGIGYTTYALSQLSVSAERIAVDGRVEVAVSVTNTGERDGAEVVQLYAGDPVAQVTRPLKQLIGFARVALAAGQTRRVSFSVHADRFCFTGRDLRRIVEPGTIELSVGHSSEDRPLSASLLLTGEVRDVGDRPVLDTPVTID